MERWVKARLHRDKEGREGGHLNGKLLERHVLFSWEKGVLRCDTKHPKTVRKLSKHP